MEIIIRDAIGEDVYPIREIQKQGWLETYPNQQFGITKQDILEHFSEGDQAYKEKMERRRQTINTDENQHVWVAEEEKKVIGFCIAQKGKENRINAIYIRSAFHGKGVAKQLMNTALQWIGSNQEIHIGVATYNSRAIAFYEKFGFHKTNIIPHSDVAALPSGKVIPEIEMSNR